MKKRCLTLAVLGLLNGNVYGQQQDLGYAADLAFVGNDGPSGSDFDESWRFSAMLLGPLSSQLMWEVGLSQTTTAGDSATDNTGSYRLEVGSGDLFAGVRLESKPMGQVTAFGRAGLLYYYSEIKFSETFFGIKPGGRLKEIEEGKGYYLGAGLGFPLNENLTMTGEVTYRKRLDYFEDSRAAYDMEEVGVAIGLLLKAF